MKFEGSKPLHDWIVDNEASVAGFYAVLFTRKAGLSEVWAHAGLRAIGKDVSKQYSKLTQMVDAYQAYLTN